MRSPQDMYRQATELEECGELEQAAILYEEILKTEKHAAAAVNLGTIRYNQRDYERAVEFYRLATQIEPKYALAWFNLGNALEETRRTPVKAYMEAIRLKPKYADPHYNLALALEVRKQPRRAIKHWRIYIKLDPIGPSADHARRAIRKTIKADVLQIVWRREAA